MMGIIQEPLWGWSGNPAGGDTATTTTAKIPYNINTIQYFVNQLDIDIKRTWKIIQHDKRIQELQLAPENQYAKTRAPGNASRNQKTRTGTNQEHKKPCMIQEVPSNASPNDSSLTFMLELGQDLLGHQSGCAETSGLIWFRHDIPGMVGNLTSLGSSCWM